MPLDISCTNDEKVPVTATPRSASGRPAPVDGALRVSVLSGEGTVEQTPEEPLKFYCVSGDNMGDTMFLVEADADLGEGLVLIQDTVTLTVTSATAQSLTMQVGPPELK